MSKLLSESDRDRLSRLAHSLEIGGGVLKAPSDVAVVAGPPRLLAVADDFNGLLLFQLPGLEDAESREAVLVQHLADVKDATSVCWDEKRAQLLVSLVSASGEKDIRFLKRDSKGSFSLTDQRIPIPTEPSIKDGYIRWVDTDVESGEVFVASGDNESAALWCHDGAQWHNLLQRPGDLEHCQVLPRVAGEDPGQRSVLLCNWDAGSKWSLRQLTFGADRGLLKEQRLLDTSMEFQEPWSVGLDKEDLRMCFYEYVSGNLYGSRGPAFTDLTSAGVVMAGNWVSLALHKGWTFASVSDERKVFGFRANSAQ